MQKLFRCIQYNFIAANQVIYYLILSFSIQGVFETICALYCVITLEHSVNSLPVISVLIMVSILVLFGFKVPLGIGLRVTSVSIQFPNSYLMNEKRLSKRNKMFYKSCRPFVFRFVDLIPLGCSAFPVLINNIIVFGVINLLLTFRK